MREGSQAAYRTLRTAAGEEGGGGGGCCAALGHPNFPWLYFSTMAYSKSA